MQVAWLCNHVHQVNTEPESTAEVIGQSSAFISAFVNPQFPGRALGFVMGTAEEKAGFVVFFHVTHSVKLVLPLKAGWQNHMDQQTLVCGVWGNVSTCILNGSGLDLELDYKTPLCQISTCSQIIGFTYFDPHK